MATTTITCPQCSFSRTLAEGQIPTRTVRIVCPICNQRFIWQRQALPESREFDAGSTTRPATPTPAPAALSPQQAALLVPKAGFVLRCAAAAIDAVIYLAILLLVIFGMSLIIASNGGDNPQALAMMSLLALFVVLAFDYLFRVLFIGYCGQTPGKMTTRIKVIRCDGTEVGYGAAIFREVIGKFISALLLLVGYVMIGFDEQCQGLHDKIADTYVIKL